MINLELVVVNVEHVLSQLLAKNLVFLIALRHIEESSITRVKMRKCLTQPRLNFTSEYLNKAFSRHLYHEPNVDHQCIASHLEHCKVSVQPSGYACPLVLKAFKVDLLQFKYRYAEVA